MWEGMPPLVDAYPSTAASRMIPPPSGASVLSHGHAPPAVPPMNAPQYPWGTPYPSTHHFSSPQDTWAAWNPQYTAPAYPQSMPSPYIPRQPPIPEMQPQDPWAHLRKGSTSSHSTHSAHSTHKQSNSLHKLSPWPQQGGGDLSPLFDVPSRMPDPNPYVPRAPDMYTPTSSQSSSAAESSRIPPGMYRERPQQWRHDFKFKSGFASVFRSKSSNAKALDEFIDSARLELHPCLRHSRSIPPTIYDLRHEALSVSFRELERPPLASDMDQSVTRPPTKYMRLYHPRLPWYIDIRANGASYISLGDFFQQLSASLNQQINKYDFYNNDLDNEDRGLLTRAYLDRCHNDDEKMQGVKRVDFLRGKVRWEGLTPGKNGMWRLRTGT